MPHYTYILSSHSRVLYIGMTNDLQRRLFEHKTKAIPGFTADYNVNQLVCFEEMEDAVAALAREKQLKGWTRKKKIALIEKMNPLWCDLGDRWFTSTELNTGMLNDGRSILSASVLAGVEGSCGGFGEPQLRL